MNRQGGKARRDRKAASSAPRREPARSPDEWVHPILSLQATVGNEAVRGLVEGAPEGGGEGASPPAADGAEPRPAPDQAIRGPGRPLPDDLRRLYEDRYGRAFEDVRVHTGETAGEAVLAAQARAFTIGRDIVFGPGQYRPGSAEGRTLLAHELAHVVHQSGVAPPNADRTEPEAPTTRAPDGLEREATTAAAALTGTGPVHLSEGAAAAGVPQFDRGPDISHRGLHTFRVGTSDHPQVMAIQIGVQPNSRRVSVRVAATTRGLRNPPVAERSMVVAISPTAPLSPRIIGESENELPEGDVYQKTFAIQLNSDPDTPILSVVMIYGRRTTPVPFPEGGTGVWRNRQTERGWLQVSDGLRELIVNFPTEVPGSLWSSEWRPYVHPRLGYGFLNQRTRQYHPYPLGRPNIRAQEEAIRFAIHLIPIVGSLVMAGEALVGQSIWGRPLSGTERALLGAGAVLAEIGPILRTGAAATRTVRAVSRLTTVTRISRIEALRLVIGARYLTDAEMATLQRLAAQVRAGQALTDAEQVLINRLMGKLNEASRAVAVRGEVAATTGTARQAGRYTDLPGSASADEARVGQALADDLGADVVRVPESTAEGVRTGDYLIDDVFAEAYSPRTGNLDNLLRQAVKKHQQAGVLVIDITHTPLAQSTVVGSAQRIFGRPEAADLYRLIYVRSDRVVADVARAGATRSQVPGVFIRGAASAAAQGSR